MLTPGDWRPWAPPPIRLLTPLPVGAAEAAWQAEAAAALAAAGPADPDAPRGDAVVGLGLATVPELCAPSRQGRAVALPSPTDTDLPPSVTARLLRMAAAAGVATPQLPPARHAGPAALRAALAGLGTLKSVSVVVPNYNYGRYIEARLRGIDGQTLPVGEIIVLDDASTDDSVGRISAVLPTLSAPARLIVNPRNSGSAFRQWERGVREATGELVWIAEADDMAEPDFLARLVPAFDDPGVAMAQCQSRQVGSQGEVRHDDYGFYLAEVGAERWAQSYRTDGREQAAATLAVMNTIPNVSAVVFRREALLGALEACAAPLETFRLAGDWLAYLEVLSRGGFAFARQVLNGHRVHEASVTTSALTPLDRVLEVGRLQKIARDRLSPPPETVAAAGAYLQKLYAYFGLAEGGPAQVFDHPAFAALAPGR